jgi:hypothetical protein
MFKAINAGSRQFRGPPGFPLEAEPKRHLDIVWTRSMQFDDLALIVRLQDAYCMERSKVSRDFLMTRSYKARHILLQRRNYDAA